MRNTILIIVRLLLGVTFSGYLCAAEYHDLTFEAGHESLQVFLLPVAPSFPLGNYPNRERIALGKMLFFDTRLSGDGNMSCATCHNPLYGWSDSLPTAKGFHRKVLNRASPTLINTAYNSLLMWDGRTKSLEDHAMAPKEAAAEMNMDIPGVLEFLNANEGYKAAFAKAYPDEEIAEDTVSKAIASFERTVVSRNSSFDRWVRGDAGAMNYRAVNGFRLFMDPQKGGCGICHSGPNFTDNGFHNIGLGSYGRENADVGRFAQEPQKPMKGAFKTPTVRDSELSAPYFHDGSATTLEEVVDHYEEGGIITTNLSPNMKRAKLSKKEKRDLLLFLHALTSEHEPFTLPKLPL